MRERRVSRLVSSFGCLRSSVCTDEFEVFSWEDDIPCCWSARFTCWCIQDRKTSLVHYAATSHMWHTTWRSIASLSTRCAVFIYQFHAHFVWIKILMILVILCEVAEFTTVALCVSWCATVIPKKTHFWLCAFLKRHGVPKPAGVHKSPAFSITFQGPWKSWKISLSFNINQVVLIYWAGQSWRIWDCCLFEETVHITGCTVWLYIVAK